MLCVPRRYVDALSSVIYQARYASLCNSLQFLSMFLLSLYHWDKFYVNLLDSYRELIPQSHPVETKCFKDHLIGIFQRKSYSFLEIFEWVTSDFLWDLLTFKGRHFAATKLRCYIRIYPIYGNLYCCKNKPLFIFTEKIYQANNSSWDFDGIVDTMDPY